MFKLHWENFYFLTCDVWWDPIYIQQTNWFPFPSLIWPPVLVSLVLVPMLFHFFFLKLSQFSSLGITSSSTGRSPLSPFDTQFHLPTSLFLSFYFTSLHWFLLLHPSYLLQPCPHKVTTIILWSFELKTAYVKLLSHLTVLEPNNFQEALAHWKWMTTVDDEYNAFVKNKTWSLVSLPPIGVQWAVNGSLNKKRILMAHFPAIKLGVVKGFHQQAGLDFLETFSLVVQPTTIRVVLTVALAKGWAIRQLDINNAFLHGFYVYMNNPQVFNNTKRIPQWLNCIKPFLGSNKPRKLGLRGCNTVFFLLALCPQRLPMAVFFFFGPVITQPYSFWYTLMILFTGSSTDEILSLVSHLNAEFSVKDLGTRTTS